MSFDGTLKIVPKMTIPVAKTITPKFNEILFLLAYFRLNVMKIPFGTCIYLTKSHINCQNINSYNRCNMFSIMSTLSNGISLSTNHLKHLKYN